MLRRQRAIEIVPGSKPLRWRRYDVPQHLAPETSDALRFCAVEGDLDLLDRRHRSTIEAGLSSSPRARPWLGCGACGRLLKMSGTLSRGMTILTVSMPTTFGSPVSPRSTTRVERSGFTYTAHAVSTMTQRVVPGIVLTSAHRHYARDLRSRAPFGPHNASYAGDRGAERPVLGPHGHLHNKHVRSSPDRSIRMRSRSQLSTITFRLACSADVLPRARWRNPADQAPA